MFLSQKFANMRSTKALRDSAEFHEGQPTPATLYVSITCLKESLNFWYAMNNRCEDRWPLLL